MYGGERGIRTPGRFPVNGFQDRRFRPLSQLSVVCYCRNSPGSTNNTTTERGNSLEMDLFTPISSEAGNDTESLWALPGTCPRIATVTKAKTGLTHT